MRKKWFSVKLIFGWYKASAKTPVNFEERIILIFASSFESAIALAEKEAIAYSRDASDRQVKVKYEKYASAYELFANKITHLSEVFSLTVNNVKRLSAKRYIDVFHDNGTQNTKYIERRKKKE